MKLYFLPKSFVGRLSLIIAILVPVVNFISFAIDTALPYLILFLIFAWLILGIIALIKRDWSIVTVISVIMAIFTLTQLRGYPGPFN
ncbi:hypothetical protein E9840_10915 [Tissierella creatinini]|nr:hypothetical protein E9840_10915 [Tissierella creatinini]TJX32160.1 hypothetical protein E8P77_35920 [Soehngenia saccharolytica]